MTYTHVYTHRDVMSYIKAWSNYIYTVMSVMSVTPEVMLLC